MANFHLVQQFASDNPMQRRLLEAMSTMEAVDLEFILTLAQPFHQQLPAIKSLTELQLRPAVPILDFLAFVSCLKLKYPNLRHMDVEINKEEVVLMGDAMDRLADSEPAQSVRSIYFHIYYLYDQEDTFVNLFRIFPAAGIAYFLSNLVDGLPRRSADEAQLGRFISAYLSTRTRVPERDAYCFLTLHMGQNEHFMDVFMVVFPEFDVDDDDEPESVIVRDDDRIRDLLQPDVVEAIERNQGAIHSVKFELDGFAQSLCVYIRGYMSHIEFCITLVAEDIYDE